MDLGMRGKAAFVAGGTMGLGRAVALELITGGAKVAICGLDESELARRPRKSARNRGRDHGLPVDVSDSEQARAFIRTGIDHFGTPDILVNNAGGPPSATFLDIEEISG